MMGPGQSGRAVEEAVPEIHGSSVLHACAHEGRVVVFLWNGKAFERAAGGSWSLYTRAEAYRCNIDGTRRLIYKKRCVSGSVLLG